VLQYRAYSNESRHDAAKTPAENVSKQPDKAARDERRTTETTSTNNTDSSTEAQGQEAPEVESLTSSVSKYLNLPRIPHRPTKEELLAAATNFRQRLKVRFKWMSIRSMRPWNADEWGAFVSWFMLGHLVWILVGTTTFFSLVILSINTVFAQGKQLWVSPG
jgi:distribution and morphology protein 31